MLWYLETGIKYCLIAKDLNRLVVDKDGPLIECLMRCPEKNFASGSILKGTPKHLDPGIDMFPANQFIDGPTVVLLDKGYKMNLATYDRGRIIRTTGYLSNISFRLQNNKK